MDTAIVLLGLIIVFALPACVPAMRQKPSSPPYKWAFYLMIASEAIQTIFIVAVGANVIPLSYSLKFAALGAPLSVSAAGAGVVSKVWSGSGVGCVVTGSLTLLLWLFLISLH